MNCILRDRMTPTVYGVGYFGNNRDLKTYHNGKKCRIYDRWLNMIGRCYDENLQKKLPTYIGCKVIDEWKDYSKWREWYDNYQYKHEGWQLDKDLLVKGNKIYSPETCVFLPHIINSCLTSSKKSRGDYLIGVYYNKAKKKFQSNIRMYGVTKYLGYFTNELDAHLAYKEAKELYLKQLADEYKDMLDPRAYEALYTYTVNMNE